MRRWFPVLLLGVAGLAMGQEAPAPTSVTELNAWGRSADILHFGAPRRTESQVIELEGIRVELGAGTLSPILYGGPPEFPKLSSAVAPSDPTLQNQESVVGFAWEGEGRVQADLSHNRTGAWLANWQHRLLGLDPASLSELAAGRFAAAAEQVIAFGARGALLDFIEDLPPAPGAFVFLERDRAETELRAPSRATAARIQLMREQLHLPEAAPATVHVLTDQRFGLVMPERSATGRNNKADRWLTWEQDPASAHRYELATTGQPPGQGARWRTLLEKPWADQPEGDGLPPRGVSPVHADLTLQVKPSRDRLYAELQAEATLTVEAREDLRTFTLSLPSSNARPDSAKVRSVTLRDGRPVLFSPHPKGWLSFSRLDIVLPEPVPAGTTLMLEVEWEGTWDLEAPGIPYPGTGLQDLLPTPLPAGIGAPWTYTARVSVPADSGMSVALSGPTARRWTDGGGLAWTEVTQERPARWPSVSVGEWASLEAPGAEGLPALTVRLFPDLEESLAGFAGEIGRALSAYHQLLPPYPFEELEIAQAQDQAYGFTWIAPHGVINVQQGVVFGTTDMRAYSPHLEEGVLAHELAHGWFGHVAVPARTEDFWIAESFSESLSCIYLAAAYGAADCAARMDGAARTWLNRDRRRSSAALSRAYYLPDQADIVYLYGPYVVHHMLRGRLGDAAYVQGIQALVEGGDPRLVTTQDVQAAFEASSGQDLQDFFDFWIRGGFIPQSLVLATRKERREDGWYVLGELESDVPFGRFDVQLQIRDGEANYTVPWVEVVDGAGAFELGPFPGELAPIVRLDPADLTLARGKRQKRLR
ncbi:MAG: hypothetical protein H6741_32430 [Alphaproteobacteria bacterium]|nr:hypothetical protein [Alphaproteobacteria bacterium]MCB9797422.1 hypothetical protein [Alphaproteobacteria bacterium]